MRRGGSVSGAVSMVMIFCVLCLVVFTVLTLSSAEQERSLSVLTAQRAASWYEADRQAVAIVAALERGETPEAVTRLESARDEAVFQVPVTEDQSIQVRVQMQDGRARILQWETVYTGDWEPDGAIDLWGGDFFSS